MAYEKRKAPKVKIKQKDDKVSPEKIERKKRKSPSRKAPVEKRVKSQKSNDDFKSTFQLLRGGKKDKKIKKRHSIITTSVAIGLILTVIIFNFVTPTGIVEWSQNMFMTWGNGGGLPVAVSGDSIKEMQARSNGMFIVTDSHMYAYNSSGKQITSVQHGYTQPIFDMSAARTLMYDRGSYGIRVDAYYTNIVNTQLK